MPKNKWLSENHLLMKQWFYENNTNLNPLELTAYSNYKVWWVCSKGHKWQATINNRSNGSNCPVCSGRKVLKGFNDLKTKNPQLASEWHYEKNGALLPEHVPASSTKRVWWKCKESHEFEGYIYSRNQGSRCPYCAGKKPIVGKNDLETMSPKAAKEWDYDKNIGVTPKDVCYASSKKCWWICEKGHSWKAVVGSRIKHGCPFCNGQKVLKGFNDIHTKAPHLLKEWDYEKNDLLPTQVAPNSKQEIWWKCDKGHSWKTKVHIRNSGSSCPYCSGRKVLSGANDLKTLYPEIAKEWDYAKNGDMLPENTFARSVYGVWWKCENGHSWKSRVHNRTNGRKCPYCVGKKAITGENDLLTLKPELAKEWDYERNSLDINRLRLKAIRKCGGNVKMDIVIKQQYLTEQKERVAPIVQAEFYTEAIL